MNAISTYAAERAFPLARGWGREDICNAVVPARLERSMWTLFEAFRVCLNSYWYRNAQTGRSWHLKSGSSQYSFEQRTAKIRRRGRPVWAVERLSSNGER